MPSRLAHRARPIRQFWTDATLSRLLPPSPATPGSGCLQLHPTATTARRRWPSTSVRTNSASWRTDTLLTNTPARTGVLPAAALAAQPDRGRPGGRADPGSGRPGFHRRRAGRKAGRRRHLHSDLGGLDVLGHGDRLLHQGDGWVGYGWIAYGFWLWSMKRSRAP